MLDLHLLRDASQLDAKCTSTTQLETSVKHAGVCYRTHNDVPWLQDLH